MKFNELVNRGNALALGSFGESVTLVFGTSRIPATAVVDIRDENAELLVSGISGHQYVLTMDSITASRINADWLILVRGKMRPVLAIITAGVGLDLVYLGDPEDEQ
jgi:hypothetical protein